MVVSITGKKGMAFSAKVQGEFFAYSGLHHQV
jgi:hypothetical protein